MKLEFKKSNISIKPHGVKKSMMPYIRQAMDRAEERLIEIIKSEIDLVSGSPSEWRDILKGHIKHIREEVTNDVINYYVGPGYQDDPDSALWMRAMVIAFGNAPPIYAGPLGVEVWDNNLWAKKDSEIETQREIPATWYHEGRNYIENAITMMRTEFADIVIGELSNMPASVFTSNMVVTMS